jgi:hypothetical protein
MAKSIVMEVICENCGILFSKRVFPKTKFHYCSVNCKRADKKSFVSDWTTERREALSAKMSGESNPNFANHWSDEQKLQFSKLKVEQYKEDPKLAYRCGASNRGAKFSAERIFAMHGHREKASYRHYPTDEVRKIIGEKSKAKWTDEYRAAHRKTMEEAGYWIPLQDKDPYKIYYKNANWISNMIEYYNDAALANLSKFGIFGKSNTKGWVRDHIVPRKVGYIASLPVQILRHPANLQLISHSDNVKKGFADRRLTENEQYCIIAALFERIENFDKEWAEQEFCLQYIRGIK